MVAKKENRRDFDHDEQQEEQEEEEEEEGRGTSTDMMEEILSGDDLLKKKDTNAITATGGPSYDTISTTTDDDNNFMMEVVQTKIRAATVAGAACTTARDHHGSSGKPGPIEEDLPPGCKSDLVEEILSSSPSPTSKTTIQTSVDLVTGNDDDDGLSQKKEESNETTAIEQIKRERIPLSADAIQQIESAERRIHQYIKGGAEEEGGGGGAHISGGQPHSSVENNNDDGLDELEIVSLVRAPVPPAPAMPALARGQRNATETQPGAFAGAPGSQLQRLANAASSAVGNHPDSNQTTINNNNVGLVQANPVQEDNDMIMDIEATPFDVQSAQRKMTRKKKRERMMTILLGLLVCAAVAAVGIVLTKRDKKKEQVAEDAASVGALFTQPTLNPSGVPSEVPSMAPSRALDVLMANLPAYTQLSLQNSSTPQWQAWDWLSHHPQLFEMEEWRKVQLFALATFYFSMQGPSWKKEIAQDWLSYDSSSNECFWFSHYFGVFDNGVWTEIPTLRRDNICNHAGEFTHLVLERLELSSIAATRVAIPPEIELLSSLSWIRMAYNNFNVPIAEFLPSQISRMSNLIILNLQRNNLRGGEGPAAGTATLPSQIAELSNLQILGLSNVSLSGTIPTEFGRLTNLVDLSLHDNYLAGTVPSQLGLMTQLSYLGIYINSLSGPIPSELFAMAPNMTEFFVEENMLTGYIPTEIATLSSSLTRLGLHLNLFTGPIPTELGLLSNLRQLATTGCPLSGPLPSQIGTMSSAEALSIAYNFLSGLIPSELGALPSLFGIDLEANANLYGPIPSEFWQLSYLHALSLRSTGVSGLISTEFGQMNYLQGLYLGDTLLSGPIPSELGLLHNLYVLDLSNMPLLAGPIPSHELSHLELGVLRLSGSTGLSGTIPEDFCNIGAEDSSTFCNLDREVYWWLEFRTDIRECMLDFDCTDTLCGCNSCPCHLNMNSSNITAVISGSNKTTGY